MDTPNTKVLVKFKYYEAESLIILNEEQLEDLRVGTCIFILQVGECFDVEDYISEGDVRVLSRDQEKIEWLLDVNLGEHLICGENPLSYVMCLNCGNCRDECECKEGFVLMMRANEDNEDDGEDYNTNKKCLNCDQCKDDDADDSLPIDPNKPWADYLAAIIEKEKRKKVYK